MLRFQVMRNMFPHQSYTKHMTLLKTFSSSTSEDTPAVKPAQNIGSSKLTENVFNSCFSDEGEQFRYLLRNSNFINMGDPENKVVHGKIFKVVNNDLYIDFGWKFYCVCSRPTKGGEFYVRGAEVLLKIKELELSSKFLGSEKALTLLEADAFIVKLLYSPHRDFSAN